MVSAFPADTQVIIDKTSGGKQKLTGSDRHFTSRAGKGRPLFKRGSVDKVQLPLPEMPDLSGEQQEE